MTSRYPIVLPNHHVQRIISRDARLLILTRTLPSGGPRKLRLYEVHNALIVRRNLRHCREGRPDLQANPHVLTLEVTSIESGPLGEVDLKRARLAGYPTVEELREDWRQRRRRLDLDLRVHLHLFEVRGERYLHRDVHRNYAHDPSEAIDGEMAALSEGELERYAAQARERDLLLAEARRGERLGRPLHERVAELERLQASGEVDVSRQLAAIRRQLEGARRRAVSA